MMVPVVELQVSKNETLKLKQTLTAVSCVLTGSPATPNKTGCNDKRPISGGQAQPPPLWSDGTFITPVLQVDWDLKNVIIIMVL